MTVLGHKIESGEINLIKFVVTTEVLKILNGHIQQFDDD